jgi:hypothetical protein
MLKSLLPQSEWLRTDPLRFESSKPERSQSRLNFLAGRAAIFASLLAAFLALAATASAQSFTLQAPALSETAIDPGGSTFATVTVGAEPGFNGSVDLLCQVTPVQPQTIQSAPGCTVSPASVTPPASASATITTTGGTTDPTTTTSYNVTITGTSASNNQTTTTPALYMTVIDVAPQFTITVEKTVEPGSVPAGNNGVGTITINPINGYVTPSGQNGITLSCSSITPLVTVPPVCSFSPNPVRVNPGQITPSALTIITYGPVVTTGSVVPPRTFYGHFWGHSLALWLPLPMLALVGLGAAAGGKRSRKAWWLLGLFVVSGALLLMPACGNTTTNTSTPNGVTPNNTYTFTISGVDDNGVVSSNAGSGSTNPTVSLAVTTATTN